jgi:hypothetical protein
MSVDDLKRLKADFFTFRKRFFVHRLEIEGANAQSVFPAVIVKIIRKY